MATNFATKLTKLGSRER